jgi:hypothetical protein
MGNISVLMWISFNFREHESKTSGSVKAADVFSQLGDYKRLKKNFHGGIVSLLRGYSFPGFSSPLIKRFRYIYLSRRPRSGNLV